MIYNYVDILDHYTSNFVVWLYPSANSPNIYKPKECYNDPNVFQNHYKNFMINTLPM